MKQDTPFWVFPLIPFMLAYGLLSWAACWLYSMTYLSHKEFIKYCLIGGITAGLGTLALWFGREKLGINVAILNPLVVISFFLIKYILYKRTKMLGGI